MKTWIERLLGDEPVLTRIGPAIALLAGYLVTRGVLDGDTGQLIAALVTVLGGGGALAAARGLVTPMSRLGGTSERPE